MARPVPPLRTHTNRFGLREWQHRAMAAMAAWREGPFLLSAAPGAGKTRPALEFAREQLASGAMNAVVVACPTAPLTRQWARAADGIGLDLAPDTDTPRPPSGFHGVSVTYARIAKAPLRWARALPRRSLIIADEAHHLGEDLSWGVGFTRAFGSEARWLLLSGTPFRSDATPIPDGLPVNRRGCWPVVPFSNRDVAYVNALEQRLNSVLRRVAQNNGVTYVDTYTSSIGHDACTPPGTAWVNSIIPTSPGFPLHPNQTGEQNMANQVLSDY